MSEQATGLLVRTHIGRFNLLDPQQESVSIHVRVPGFATMNLNVPIERGEHLDNPSMPWNGVIAEALDIYIEKTWFSTDLSEAKRLREWLRDDDNDDYLWRAWAEQRLAGLRQRSATINEEIAKLETGLQLTAGGQADIDPDYEAALAEWQKGFDKAGGP